MSDFANYHPMEILVLEDNKVNMKVVDLMLRRLGHHPSFSSDGNGGRRTYMDLRPEVMFMDIQKPVMDGIQYAREIQSRENGFACDIIGLSARVLKDTRNEAKSFGFNEYLFEPVYAPSLKKRSRKPTLGC
ncbi:MAG: response regulator [Opitutales bacterium]|nr:response regulator [Opitutales bacterium]